MSHDEMVEQFAVLGLQRMDSIELTLNDGSVISGKLSDNRVFAVEREGRMMNSRIGIFPPDPPRGSLFGNQLKSVSSESIVRIRKL